jgi:hypothetical protein
MAEVLIRPKNVSNEQWNKAVQLYNVAKDRGDRYPELTVAQAALETGWFKSPAGKYNYFGQKATASQKGSTKSTREAANNSYYRTSAKFRDYDTLEEAVDDRVRKWGSKYNDAENIDEAISSIWRYNPKTGSGEGYATDIKYGSKLKTILGSMGVSSNKSNPQSSPQETQEFDYDNRPVGDYYVDSTIRLNENSGEYMSAPDYYETGDSTEDNEGNIAKDELKQAQQEKNFVNELFNKQQQQEVAQGYNQNTNGYQLYNPELPEFQTQQAPGYFQEGGIVGKIDYEKFKKSLQRFEEGGDFVDTYLEEDGNPFGEQPKTFQQQIAEDYKQKEKPDSTPKPTQKAKPKSKVDELIAQYGSKPGEKIKVDERALKVKPFTGVKEGASTEYVEKIQKKELEKRGLTDKDIQAKMKEAELKNSVDYFAKQLSGKATLEDTIENKDIDLGIGLSNYKTVDERKKLQKFLIDQGYNLNPEGKFENSGIDGKIGKVTLKAVQEYNKNLSNPNYYSFKEGEGLLGKCTEGQCSEYTQNELFRNIQPNVSRQEWNAKTGLYGNAWDIGKNITAKGGKEVDRKTVKPGDVVTMYTGGSSLYQGEANAAGTGTTHVGIVDKINPDGSYYILHNVHTLGSSGDWEGREFRDLVKGDIIRSDNNNNGFAVRGAFRPKYEAVESGEKKVLREDLSIKLDPKKASKLSSGDYNNFFTSKSAKEKLENYYIKPLNDSKNKKALSKVFNLGDDEYNSLAKASLGILGQESEFGTNKQYTTGVKKTGAGASKVAGYIPPLVGLNELSKATFGKDFIKTDEISKGAGQMKYETNFGNDDLTEIGVTRENFNDEDKASLTTMYKLSRDYKKFLNKGFSKKDALYRAITNYNSSMGRVVAGKKVEDWAKDYDVDYANKVLNFSNFFDVTDGKKSYKTTSDNLLLNKNVAKWKNTLKKEGKI